MDSSSEGRDALGGETVVRTVGPCGNGAPADGRALLALTRKGRVLATAPARGLSLSVGRSSGCALRCGEPSFPRHAGDVIVQPVPIFRFAADRSGQAVVPLKRKRPVAVHGCRLHLLEEGDVLRNTPLLGRRRGRVLTLALFCAIGSVIGGSMIIEARTACERPAVIGATVAWPDQPAPAASSPGAPTSRRSAAGPGPASDRRPGTGKGMEPRAAPVPTRLPTPRAVNTPSPAPPPPAALVRPRTMEDGAFRRVLIAARARMMEQDPRAAGALFAPVLGMLSAEQTAEAIEALEPHAAEAFKKAYLGIPYRRAASLAALEALDTCGLGVLPSCRRAGEYLRQVGQGLMQADDSVDRRSPAPR